MQRDDADDTASLTGTGALKVGSDVGRAADVAVIVRDTLADPHASVASAVDDQNLVFSDARRVECLPLAILSPFCIANHKVHGRSGSLFQNFRVNQICGPQRRFV